MAKRVAQKKTNSLLVFDANGTTGRVANVSSVTGFKPATFTIIGWQLSNIRETVRGLQKRSQVRKKRGMKQDELGIWGSPGGGKVAWFKGPSGNVLSVTEK